MAQPVDLVVDRAVLLDVGVARRDVGLGLVVVVVADEVLDPVVGEELAELVGQLGRQRLVGRDDQGRPLGLLDGPGDGGALARPGDPEQGLEAVAPLDALDEGVHGRRLVAGRREVGDDLERRHPSRLPRGCDSLPGPADPRDGRRLGGPRSRPKPARPRPRGPPAGRSCRPRGRPGPGAPRARSGPRPGPWRRPRPSPASPPGVPPRSRPGSRRPGSPTPVDGSPRPAGARRGRRRRRRRPPRPPSAGSRPPPTGGRWR